MRIFQRTNLSTRRFVVIGIGIVGLMLGGVGIGIFSAPEEIESSSPVATPAPDVTIPPIDTMMPDQINTATFALG